MADTVILLHGLWRTAGSFYPLERALKREGYAVYNRSYLSWAYPFSSLVRRLRQKVLALPVEPRARVHFVGHSLGGLMIRGILGEGVPFEAGRIVMIGTPNQGASIVEDLHHVGLLHFVPAVCLRELHPDSPVIKNLPVPAAETGIIAGDLRFSLFNPVSWFTFCRRKDRPSDGTVELAHTHLPGEAAHIVLPVSHSLLPTDSGVIRQVVSFLKTGAFSCS